MNLTAFSILLKRLALALVAYSLCRLIFLIFNLNDIPPAEIVPAFFHGLQFDLSAIAYTNVLFVILSILPFKFVLKTRFQKALQIIYFCTNGLAILANLIDAEFYRFIGKRTDITIFNITGDVNDQAGQLILNYAHIPIIFILMMIIMWKIYPSSIPQKKSLSGFYRLVLSLITLLALPLLMRGGFQLKPITPINAFNNTASKTAANLTLNTAFSTNGISSIILSNWLLFP